MEIQNCEGYLIYPDGGVYSKKRKIFLKPGKQTKGYLRISLRNDNKQQKNYLIHRLIAEHYIPNPEGKPQVDHKNRNRTDNRVENLRWATNGENNHNKLIQKHNTSGHKNISYHKTQHKWVFTKSYEKKILYKIFKTKIDSLCYKFIHQLKIKALR